jgi:adenylate cyclase
MTIAAWQLRALGVGVSVAIVVAAASALPALWSWQESADLNLLFRVRGARPVPENVVIVPIDSRAMRRLFLPPADRDFERCADVQLDRAPPAYRNPNPPDVLTRWPRCLHARVLEALAVGEPDAVVMDISFRPRSDPSGIYAEQDRTLATAIRRLGRVVLARKIKSEDRAQERLQPIAAEIEAAAVAVAPFLLLGDQLQRADKFCTFVEDSSWSGPCMPTVAHQLRALGTYSRLRELLFSADSRDSDLLPVRAENLLAGGALQAPISLIRHLATSDLRAGERMRSFLQGAAAGTPPAELRLRGLADIYLGPATRYFNFYGPPGTVSNLRYEALAAANGSAIAPGSLRGKAVFIGFAEYGRPEPIEHFTTPFTTGDSVMSGVELAATAYANLEDGSAIDAIPASSRALIVLAAGLACALLCVLLPRRFAIPACLALVAAYFAASLGAFHYYALWLPLVMPLAVAAPLGMGIGLTFEHNEMKRELEWYKQEYLHTEEERAYLEKLTNELLPRGIRQRVVEHRQRLPELLQSGPGACVNTDIEGSTKYAESHDADDVRITLNNYFHLLDAVLNDHDVLTSDYTGDGLMAVWMEANAGVPALAVRKRVCAAALKLAFAADQFRLEEEKKRRERLRDQLPAQQRDEVHFETRIGVCYGDLQVGILGGATHGEYRAIGDVPNTATALQNFNKVMCTKILVSSEMVAGLEQEFLIRELGQFVLPKKAKKTLVHELVCLRSSASPTQIRTCERFTRGLRAYREGRYQEAAEVFSALGADGPSDYYLRLCADRRYYADRPVVVEPADVEWARASASAREEPATTGAGAA